ncbi:hypothetical protein OS493_040464, partial [Desmophyllum pertusum]
SLGSAHGTSEPAAYAGLDVSEPRILQCTSVLRHGSIRTLAVYAEIYDLYDRTRNSAGTKYLLHMETSEPSCLRVSLHFSNLLYYQSL